MLPRDQKINTSSCMFLTSEEQSKPVVLKLYYEKGHPEGLLNADSWESIPETLMEHVHESAYLTCRSQVMLSVGDRLMGNSACPNLLDVCKQLNGFRNSGNDII